MALTNVADVVVPSIYSAYMQTLTEVKSRLVQSGAVVRDPKMDALLAGGGKLFNLPGFGDLADDEPNVSIGVTGTPTTPKNIASHTEVGVRLSRNQSWGSLDLAATLAGADPMKAIAARVAPYWTRAFQKCVLAAGKGVFANNTADDAADYTVDITGAYAAGTTDFSAEAFIDALATMGDSEGDLGIVIMHSVVYAKAKKNNLIDFVADATNPGAADIPFFLGKRVLVDDGMPVSTQDYDTWIVGPGAFRWGVGVPEVPIESERDPSNANGGGSSVLYSRVEWLVHPTGHAYIGTAPDGGPDNTANAHMLGAAASWNRVFPQRKQIKIARLRTTEA